MAVIHQLELQEKLVQALYEAQKTSRFVLFSYVQKTNDDLTPLSFFSSKGKIKEQDAFYWSDPADHEIIAGVGSAFTIDPKNQNSFEVIREEWGELLKGYIPFSEHVPSKTGPILLGGFPFDPLHKKNKIWEEFTNAKFVLPTFMFTKKESNCWLTVNVVFNPKDSIEKCKIIIEKYELLLEEAKNKMEETRNSLTTITEKDKENWLCSVKQAAQDVRDGKLDKLVLAREVEIKAEKAFSLATIIKNLKNEQPSSFIFAFNYGEACFLGASPERLVKKEQDQLFSTCLAGSIGRGTKDKEDSKLGAELLNDNKNLYEHAVVVRMIKSAMQKHCHDVYAPEKPSLYKVRDIQHLFTPVVGTMNKESSLLSVVKELHPTPALGGFPQLLALEKIREIEKMDRGWYAAPVGWMDCNGDGEFAVAIRSALIKEDTAYLYAGCGIVADSDPQSEYEETNMKLRPMLSAIGGLEHE